MQRKSLALNGFIGVAVVTLGIVGYTSLGTTGAAASTTSTATVKRGVVLSSVSATGNVLAQAQLEVNFDSSAGANVVTQILVKPGDKVIKGQVLAKVDDRSAQLALAGAQATLASAQAQLDKLRNGLTPQELAQDQATLDQSQLSVDNAAAAVDNAVATAAQNAVTSAASVSQAQQGLVNASASADHDLSVLQGAVDQAKAKNDAAALATAQAALTAGQLKDQQSVQAAQNALTNAQNSQAAGALKDSQAVDGAKRQYATAQAQYNSAAAANAVKEKPPTPADLAQQQAAVANATNQLATAQKNLDATTLVAPVAATVAAVNGKLAVPASTSGASSSGSGGSTNSASSSSSSGSGFVSLTDLSALQVKVGFSEADAAKLKVGQATTITFDALTGVSLTGTVQSIDTASTLVSNVVTYYAYIAVDPNPASAPVKVGMTASVQVVVSKADNVLMLPATAISARGTNATVSLQTGSSTTDTQARQVTLGLKGDQSVEITTGLSEGDKIVVTRTSGTGSSGANAARLAGTGAVAGGLGGGGAGGGGGFVGAGAGGRG